MWLTLWKVVKRFFFMGSRKLWHIAYPYWWDKLFSPYISSGGCSRKSPGDIKLEQTSGECLVTIREKAHFSDCPSFQLLCGTWFHRLRLCSSVNLFTFKMKLPLCVFGDWNEDEMLCVVHNDGTAETWLVCYMIVIECVVFKIRRYTKNGLIYFYLKGKKLLLNQYYL